MLYTLGNVGEAVNPLGRQTIWLPGGAWSPDDVNGPERLPPSGHLVFDEAIQQSATTEVYLPKSWDGQGLKAQILWKHAATTIDFDVVFGIQAEAMSDGDDYAAGFGSAQTITDTGGVTDRVYDSPETANIVPANSPAGGKLHLIKFYRDPASDNLNAKATVIGVNLFYDINRAKDN